MLKRKCTGNRTWLLVTLTEVKELLSKVAAVDNRDLSELTAKAWYEVIGGVSYDVAQRALILARQDPRINWIEPKHILGKSRDAILDLNKERASHTMPDEDRWTPSQPPSNYAEMVKFYKDLYKIAPWHVDTDIAIQRSADKVGWIVPVAKWE